ncbi:MAG: hypothetical protein MJ025_04385 [Victivallaceae bacterium]|nr:hypothetical protein [Victivallaceae bacterium]
MSLMRKMFGGISGNRGSVLMEFIIVLPVYIASLGGIMMMGMAMYDSIALRTTDHWVVWNAGYRGTRYSSILALSGLFERGIVKSDEKRALQAEKSYLQFIGGKTSLIGYEAPDYVQNWVSMPYTVTGENAPHVPMNYMSTSRFGNKHTSFVVMRTKGSATAKRHWEAGLIADDKNIWQFSDDNSKYPAKWESKLLDNPKYTDDTVKEKSEPSEILIYERFEPFVEWSK